jgi:hypothetical protein
MLLSVSSKRDEDDVGDLDRLLERATSTGHLASVSGKTAATSCR